MDFDNLEYPGLDNVVTKNISYSHNVHFAGELKNKKIKIDNNLYLLDDRSDRNAVEFLRQFVAQKTLNRRPSGSFFSFSFKSDGRRRPYDAMDRVRTFMTATRIYTGKKADSNFDFSVKNSKSKEYYRPFDLRTDKHDSYEFRNHSYIENKKDFNVIKKIHNRLREAKFEKPLHYSKIYNAVKFFNHAYDEYWTLLKTTLFFTALESLFSDSSKSEVTEKIAMRAAYLLHPKSSEKRKEVYVFVKRGYEIRSLFVHGSNTEAGVNRIMKKFEKEKNVEHYSFHHEFIEDLHALVCACLKRSILENDKYNFFRKEKHKDQEESLFYSNLVL